MFVFHILKAIQKEKSNVAIKFAGIFMIYVLFDFVCNNDKIEMDTVCVLELQTPRLKTLNSSENSKLIKSH